MSCLKASDNNLTLTQSHEFSCRWPCNPISQSREYDFKIDPCRCLWKLIIKNLLNSKIQIGIRRTDKDTHVAKFTICLRQKYETTNYGNYQYSYDSTNLLRLKTIILDLQSSTSEIFSGDILKTEVILPESNMNTLKGTVLVTCNCLLPQNKRKRQREENVTDLQNDIHSPLKKKQFTDIVLKVDKTSIPAHKFVLCARSPVFRKMFQHNMKEVRKGVVHITDVEIQVLKTFLDFLYSGILNDKTYSTVTALYSMADKYEVKSLQDTCRNHLTSSISKDTVLDILQLTDLHSDEILKDECTKFICEDFAKIEMNPIWNSLLDKNPRLASFVLRNLSNKYSKK